MFNPLDILSTYTLGTPDFGRSDVWNFNFALKSLLSKTLKDGYFPFWSKDIGTGFPLLGEGQIGMFNLANFLLFKFLDPILAFNLSFFIIFATAASGTYLFCRSIKLKKLTGLFAAGVFAISGFFIVQATHFNLIQAASFLPWELFLIESYLQKRQKRWLIIFTLVVSQQMFAGFQQLTEISLLISGLYLFLRCRQEKTFWPLLSISFAIVLSVILSLPQLLPSRELMFLSGRSGGLPIAEIARFPYHPKNLLTFFSPYLWGDPRIGTYPPFSADWGIFWESTAYIGILPLLLVPLAFLKNKKLGPVVKILATIAGVSFVLMLGKYTPLFFLYQFPPLSYFRVPARFLYPFTFCLVIFAAIALNKITNRLLVLAIFAISLLHVAYFALTYHPIINARDWLTPPEFAQIVKRDPGWFRVYDFNPYTIRNQYFQTIGWEQTEPYFLSRNTLDPNQNLYWNIPSADYYAGIDFRRLNLQNSIIQQSNTIKDNGLLIASASSKMLSLTGVKYFTSSIPVSYFGDKYFDPIATSPGELKYYLYQNPNPYPHAYLTTNFIVAKSINELSQLTSDIDNTATVLEETIPLASSAGGIKPVVITKNSDLRVDIEATADTRSLLVLSDSFYPGWQATIDGEATKIYPANINQRAIIVPKGDHKISFQYHPLKIF